MYIFPCRGNLCVTNRPLWSPSLQGQRHGVSSSPAHYARCTGESPPCGLGRTRNNVSPLADWDASAVHQLTAPSLLGTGWHGTKLLRLDTCTEALVCKAGFLVYISPCRGSLCVTNRPRWSPSLQGQLQGVSPSPTHYARCAGESPLCGLGPTRITYPGFTNWDAVAVHQLTAPSLLGTGWHATTLLRPDTCTEALLCKADFLVYISPCRGSLCATSCPR